MRRRGSKKELSKALRLLLGEHANRGTGDSMAENGERLRSHETRKKAEEEERKKKKGKKKERERKTKYLVSTQTEARVTVWPRMERQKRG